MRFPTLHINRINAIVTNLRVSHRNNLPFIGRIGDDFLITGHRSIEYSFSTSGGLGTKSSAAKYCAVFECKYPIHSVESVRGFQRPVNADCVLSSTIRRAVDRSGMDVTARRKPPSIDRCVRVITFRTRSNDTSLCEVTSVKEL